MQAVCWNGKQDIRVERVPDPTILAGRDAIIKVTRTAICGSDLHLYNGLIPTMQSGDILGHEFMGEIVELGADVKNLRIGQRVVIPFTICCGGCFYCNKELWSFCDNSNPNGALTEKLYGFAGAGLYGYTHLMGGFAGGQAEYVRVPFADTCAFAVESDLEDEEVLFLSDIFPTGYMAAEHCNIQPGDVVAVWGCGPVGLFAIRSAYLLGAERVIAIDGIADRLEMAESFGGAETIDYMKEDVLQQLSLRTGGRGPDACIDAVGMEAHGMGFEGIYDRTKQALMLETDRPNVLRQAIQACRKGGTLSIPGVYGGVVDKIPMGSAFAKGLTFKMGQTHTPRYMFPLLQMIEQGKIFPSDIISHRLPLREAAEGYRLFNEKHECRKVVLLPGD